MTDKQRLIIDYLTDHNGQGFYFDIRDSMSLQFNDEEDFDKTLYQLSDLNIIYENDNDTLYKLTFPDLKVKFAIPHVTLFYTDKDEPRLRIEDYELFDTYDDILTEQFDIEDYYITTENMGCLEIVTLHFPDTTDKDKLSKAVQSIDKKEVERIYKINNPNDKKTYR
jgi:hypothetical protein